MDSTLDRLHLQDALVTRVPSNCTDKELRELLIHLGEGCATAAAQTMEWGEENVFWGAVTYK